MASSTVPKVSVCIPVYNGSDYIGEAIQSVLSQTLVDFELIICDNCSTDTTREIVSGFTDPRIRYVENPENLGLVGNANHCLELAKGEYVCILHHDDLMLPDNLRRKVQLLDAHSDVGFVHSNIVLIDLKGEILSPCIWNADSRCDYIETGKIVFQKFLSYLPLGASIFIGAVLARRECYQRLGGFSVELLHCNDSEMWMRMSLFYNVACISTPLVKYRVHPLSTSSSWGDYTSLPYLKEHYLAAEMVFARHSEHIPRATSLRFEVSRAFAKRALLLACNAMSEGDFEQGHAGFREALKMCPSIYSSRFFWKAVVRLVAGPVGLKFYRLLRGHSIAENI
jgi:glycosyltransferase involved in cell wall biosynthesis